MFIILKDNKKGTQVEKNKYLKGATLGSRKPFKITSCPQNVKKKLGSVARKGLWYDQERFH